MLSYKNNISTVNFHTGMYHLNEHYHSTLLTQHLIRCLICYWKFVFQTQNPQSAIVIAFASTYLRVSLAHIQSSLYIYPLKYHYALLSSVIKFIPHKSRLLLLGKTVEKICSPNDQSWRTAKLVNMALKKLVIQKYKIVMTLFQVKILHTHIQK